MPSAILSQVTVLDLVPFGNAGTDTRFFALRLERPAWEAWHPGQFVMIRPSGSGPEHVWGRPLSICHVTTHHLVLFFQVVGRATTKLAALSPGDKVDLWGPLGNALHIAPHKNTLLIAGGIGIAPFVGYAYGHPAPWNVSIEFGHRMPLGCYPFDSVNEKIDAEAHLEKTPEDRDAFLALLEQRIAEHAENGLVLACGPTPLLQAIQKFALRHNTPAQLCLETKMGCGIGACLGCVVKTTVQGDSSKPQKDIAAAHHAQTCTCGPNFWADSVFF